ncbi:hypothetical protein QBC43DRAFT_286236 [Cladorrhinum sp. PSN259]|nr:hypothetical protein QBC43DRAFT_286236 [Cladorrhinum sp. PSN259]
MADAGSQPPVSNGGSNTFVTVPVPMKYPGGLPTGQAVAQVAAADTASVPQGDRISSAPEGEECKNTQNLGDLAPLNSRIKRLEAKVTFMPQELAESRRRQESDAIVKDALGRRFTFPFTLCRTWQISLIEQAFCHMDSIWPHIEEGRYDLMAPHGEIILPSVWDQTVKPNWAVSMYMWPIEKQPSSSESICETCGQTQSTQGEVDQVVGQVSGGAFYTQVDMDEVLRPRLSPPRLIPHPANAGAHGHST